MKTAVFSLVLLLVPVTADAQCQCPPDVDWAAVEALAHAFVSDPGSHTAEALLAQFPSAETIVLPMEPQALRQVLDRVRGITIDLIADDNPWAVQLALRFLRFNDEMFEPRLTAKVSDLATTSPRFFLRQLSRFSEENPCVIGVISVVSFFGPFELIAAKGDPPAEALTARINALESVTDENLLDIRNWCIQLLEVRQNRRTDIPRILKRVDFDPSPFRGEAIRKTFVVAEATVGTDGCVKSVTILRSSCPEVDEAVSSALSKWLFEPKVVDGKAVEFKFIQSVRFHPY